MRVRIVVFEGVDELDFIGPFEVFAMAARMGGDFETRLVTTEPGGELTGGHGLRFRADGVLGGDADLVVVPGGGWVARAPAGVRAEIERGVLVRAVAEAHSRGALVASVCTGAMALAAAGLLAGREATTNQGAIEDLRA